MTTKPIAVDVAVAVALAGDIFRDITNAMVEEGIDINELANDDRVMMVSMPLPILMSLKKTNEKMQELLQTLNLYPEEELATKLGAAREKAPRAVQVANSEDDDDCGCPACTARRALMGLTELIGAMGGDDVKTGIMGLRNADMPEDVREALKAAAEKSGGRMISGEDLPEDVKQHLVSLIRGKITAETEDIPAKEHMH